MIKNNKNKNNFFFQNFKNRNWRSHTLYAIYTLITHSGRKFCSDYEKST